MDELLRKGVEAEHDPGWVVTDPDPRYVGTPL
jgi:hypothetical protein